jgi:peptidoglycan/xylan/chitin deacetylase (PgdA/CDA1 family)
MLLLYHDVYRSHPAESGFTGAIADSYKLTEPEFLRTLEALSDLPDARALRRPLARAEPPDVAFTFDDGGLSCATIVADALEARGWRAYCFVPTASIGRYGFLSAGQVRDLDARGHVIGSHSVTHPTPFAACHWSSMVDEWRASRETLEDLLGREVLAASLPGGALSDRVARSAAHAGLRWLLTSEPVRRRRDVDGCTLVGRFTIRPGISTSQLTALAAGARLPLARQWAMWTAKKFMKPLLGPAYARLGEHVHARRQAS